MMKYNIEIETVRAGQPRPYADSVLEYKIVVSGDLPNDIDRIIEELEQRVKEMLPAYLIDDSYYLTSGYFYITVREYVVRTFAEKGLIKPNTTGKRFNFNAYAWTFEK